MGTKQVKTPSASAVSAALRKAGFEKSVSSASRVRGWRNRSWGFEVKRGLKDGTVEVYHQTGDFRPNHEQQAREQAKYAEVLRAAGWDVTEDASWRHGLLVTAKDADQ